MALKSELLTLHKYFLTASRMKKDFEKQAEVDKTSPDAWSYLSLWYGTLKVVIEGWENLKLTDPSVDQLLDPEKVALLNGFRNDTFHYKPDYISSRSIKLLEDNSFVDWIRKLHDPLGSSILKQLQQSK